MFWFVFCLFVCFLSFLSSSLFFSENRGEKEHFYLCKVHLKNGRGLRELPLSGALETTGTRLSRVFSGNVRKTIGLQRKRTITLHVKLYSWLSTPSRNSVFFKELSWNGGCSGKKCRLLHSSDMAEVLFPSNGSFSCYRYHSQSSHNWYHTCGLALQSVHTSLVRSWCFSCSPTPSLSLFLLSTLLSLQVGTYEDFIVVQFYRGQSYQVYTVIYLMIGLYGRELP